MYLLAKKLGFAEKMFKNIKVENNVPVAEDILREINRGGWSTGYCGQSPERLKAHMANQSKFDVVTLRAAKDDPDVGGLGTGGATGRTGAPCSPGTRSTATAQATGSQSKMTSTSSRNGPEVRQRMSQVLLDEAETSLRASFTSILSPKDREDLVEDARDRLMQWLALRQQEGETNAQH
jgi:hypothetical protein